MAVKFKIIQYVKDYVKIGDEWRHVEAESKYECDNYDDLQNLVLTLVDFTTDKVKFEVRKEEVAE